MKMFNICPTVTFFITKQAKVNICGLRVLGPLIFLQVCLTPADTEVIFSLTSSREPPVSLVPYTSAQGLIEGVCLPQMRPACASVKGSFFYFLSFLINLAFFWRICHKHSHAWLHAFAHIFTQLCHKHPLLFIRLCDKRHAHNLDM